MEDIGEPEKLVESITYMDVPLYKAAAEGKIEEFDNCQGLNLESLKTPNYDNVLHVNLANSERTASAWSFKSRSRRSNRSDFVKKILGECPLLLLQANRKGQTPLHIAARYGRSTTVKLFIESRANGDIENLGMDELEAVREMLRLKDEESNTALHVAARYGHVGVVQALLELEDPDFPYSVNKNHETPLYLAAKGGYWRSVTILLDKWKSTVHGGPYGRTALHAAVMSGDVETTKIILKVKGDLTKETDENGHTPLHYAAHLGYNPIVEKLLKRDVSAAYIGDKKWEMTPLLMAARQGHERTVRKILFHCPACCEKVDKRGWNLLHFLAFRDCSLELILSFIMTGDAKYKYGSIKNLMDWKDASGITPQQVCDAYQGEASCKSKNDQRKMEQIVKLVKDIVVNEEVAEEAVDPVPSPTVMGNDLEKARDTQLVVAALVATVTFAAAITVPGGFKGEKEIDQGTPFLIHKAAFQTFIVTDAIAFGLSVHVLLIHFGKLQHFQSRSSDKIGFNITSASPFLGYAMYAMMIAFCTAVYVVLKPSHGLAITSCSLGLSSFFFYFLKGVFEGFLESSRKNEV
ncbi:hypothetical protein ES332_D04G228300v1 [Gossypium tomentosum]|uniref:PGG domain-containing protein n=1 Tax=Gossypium tomentosum TaxID=34277 RepID=A0A5D2LGC6_GOSTO|nr:hypothetical protein ES332_D04G228300v1 [Gossypium tomentosum]